METVTTILTLLLVFLPSLYFVKFYLKWRKNAEILNKLPGAKAYPLIGDAYQLMVPRQEIFSVLEQRALDYGPIYRTWMGIIPEVHLLKPEHVETILSSQKILDKGNVYEFLHPWLGKGLLTNTGASWHSRRKMLTPAFHFTILENFVNDFVDKAQFLVNHVLDKKSNGQVFDISPDITLCALDIICKTAMGVEMQAMTNSDSDYVTAVNEISEITTKRALSFWLHPDSIFYNVNYGKRYRRCLETLHGFTNKVIKDRKERKPQLQETSNVNVNVNEEDELIGKRKRMAFLDLLLETSQNGTKLSDVDIREEVDTFMFEGHDTTTASICWTLFMLGHNSEVQDKVAEELESIFTDNKDRSITMQDLAQMKYLERVIKESLRLYPSVPFILRKTRDIINIGGYDIPSGTTIAIHIKDMHKSPEHFPNPEQFDPDRFLPEACKNRHPFAYIPFSAGPRNCIGQKFALLEEKTVIASIIRKYKLKSIESPKDIRFYPELILKSQTGIKVSMTTRY